jgi:hypothetical protein
MARKHVHHWVVETPEAAQERWERMKYRLGTQRKVFRKLKGVCRKRGCKKTRYHALDGGIKPFTARRRTPPRKKGEGVPGTWQR